MGSLGKTSYLKEKSFENDSEHFISDSIFKRLEFDNSSSETVQNQRILYRFCLCECVFMEIKSIIMRNKRVIAISNLFK